MGSVFLDHPIFRKAAPATRERVLRAAQSRHVRRGEVVFLQGDAPDHLVGVVEGLVKVGVVARSGKEAVLNFFREGGVFGEIAVLDGRPRSADAVALIDSRLALLPRPALIGMIEDDPAVARAVIQLLCDRLRHTSLQAENVMTLGVPARVAATLLRLAEPDGDAHPHVRITQTQLAQYLGLSREIANRYLTDWERSGWVSLRKGAITLADPAALAAVCET